MEPNKKMEPFSIELKFNTTLNALITLKTLTHSNGDLNPKLDEMPTAGGGRIEYAIFFKLQLL